VPVVGATTVRQLSRIASSILAMEGRVTLLGISRWTPVGGSYRTVQRFFYTVLPNDTMLWVFFREHLFNAVDLDRAKKPTIISGIYSGLIRKLCSLKNGQKRVIKGQENSTVS
jgi:hypothetical protein